MHNNDITIFGETNYRNARRIFGIKRDDRRRHMYVIGKTGMGKSELLKQMVYSDIQAGNGLAVIDPHGELAEAMLDFIPPHRTNDVVYFNPADQHFPIAFNILESVDPEVRHLIASGLVGVFKKIWADSWGPRLEYVLRNAILALLDYPGSTLLGVLRILTDKTYRKRVLEKVQDPVVRSFWIDEYAKYPDKFAAEAIAPIQNKVGQFLSNALIRNVVGQVKSSIDIRDVMDNQKILILNLSKGRIGEDTSALLGAMMITQIQLAAMSRIDTEEEDRKDFYLYVDEFQNFATQSFSNILSEARKYRLNLIIAHQFIEQLDEDVQAAVFGNVGTIICFRVGATDAEALVKEFTPYFTEEDLVNLAKWQIYLKLMIDGVASTPFSANTLPPVRTNYDNREKVIKVSRERYAKERSVIEDKISRWASSLEEEAIEDHRAASAQPPKTAQARFNAMRNGAVPAPTTKERFSESARQYNSNGSSSRQSTSSPRVVKKQVASQAKENANTQVRVYRADEARVKLVNKPVTNSHAPRQAEKGKKVAEQSTLHKSAKQKKNELLPPVSSLNTDREVKRKNDGDTYLVACARCSAETKVSFKPDPSRPVYCRECLNIVRSEQSKKGKQQSKQPIVNLTSSGKQKNLRQQGAVSNAEKTRSTDHKKQSVRTTLHEDASIKNNSSNTSKIVNVKPGETIIL